MVDKHVYVEKDNFGNIITGDGNTVINNPNNTLSSFGHALYYPHIYLKDEEWLKHAFLFWDKISRIVPNEFMLQDSENVLQIQQETNFLENYYPNDEVKFITSHDFINFLEEYLQIKSNLDKFQLVKSKKYNDSSNYTFIHMDKMNMELFEFLEEKGLALRGRHIWDLSIKMDNEIGFLYMSFLAQSISNEKSIPIVTDNTNVYIPPNIYNDNSFIDSFEEKLGYLLIDTIIPKNINSVSISELINIRSKYNDERMVFFDEINKLSSTLPSLDNQSSLSDALHYHKTLLNRQTKELEKVFNLNGIETIKNPLIISMGASLVTDNLWGISAGLAYGAFSSYTEYERRKVEINQHPMSYLLNIKSELSKEDLFQKIQRYKSYF